MSSVQKNNQAANEKYNSVLGKLSSSTKINTIEGKKLEKIKELKDITGQIELSQLNLTKGLFRNYWILMDTDEFVTRFEKKYVKYTEHVGLRKAAEAMASDVQNRMPRGVPERMHIQRMLEQEHCLICDRPAMKGTPEYTAIEKLLPELTPTKLTKKDIEADLRKIWNNGFTLSDKYKNSNQEISESIQQGERLKENLDELKKEIESLETEINNEILNSGVDKAADIIAMAAASNQDIQKYSYQLGKIERDKETYEKQIKSFESKLKSMSVGEIDPIITKKTELLEDLLKLTMRIKESEYKGLVDLLEKKANEHYERINKPTGAFYGKIKFIETTGGGFIPEIFDDENNRVLNLNTSQTTSMKLAIIMAIITANHDRGYASKYPLIADAPISDFDPKKAKSLLIEAANTFSQSIIIIKDYLLDDPIRPNRYSPDIQRLKDIRDSDRMTGKLISCTQLDLPDGVMPTNRKELSILIKQLDLL